MSLNNIYNTFIGIKITVIYNICANKAIFIQ